jgi:hypothetical protein
MILTGEIEGGGTKFVPVLFCIPQIPHELAYVKGGFLLSEAGN